MKKLITIILILCSLTSIGQITSASYTNKGATVPFINSSVYKLNGVTKEFSQWSVIEGALTYAGNVLVDVGTNGQFTITDNTGNRSLMYINNVDVFKTFEFDSSGSGYKFAFGKQSPAYTVDVNGSINGTSYYLNGVQKSFTQWANNSNNIYFNTGNVSINTTDAFYPLTVSGSLGISDGSLNQELFTITDTTTNCTILKVDSQNKFILFDLTALGTPTGYKLGIGVETPTKTLDVNGDVRIQGDLSYELIHAVSFLEDITYDLTLTTKDRYYKITPTFPKTGSNVEIDGITFAGDSLTIVTPGDYYISFGFSMVSGTNNEEYKWAVFKNNVKQYGQKRTWTTGNVAGGNIIMYLTSLVAGDDISFRMTNLSNNTDVARLSNLNFYIEKKPE